MNFTEDLGIIFVDDKLAYDSSRFTFRVESTGAASCIDHFALYLTRCIMMLCKCA